VRNYSTITELPGQRASREQLERLYHRYKFASTVCEGKDVLEVACGAGLGLGYLENVAKRVVGGDIQENILRFAASHYDERQNIEVRTLDAHRLPFKDKSFDVVILFEAIYYLEQPEEFLDGCRRVLQEKGILLICTVNKHWSDFNPSPHSVKYFSVPELYQLLGHQFPHVELYGAFSVSRNSATDKIISLIKRMAVVFYLMPKTMKGKELFKRMFFGKLAPLPNEIEDGMCKYIPPVPISYDSPNHQYKVFYAVAGLDE
jgi:ubiquinone/menaquinone biosynthesis C-methylase UbiE